MRRKWLTDTCPLCGRKDVFLHGERGEPLTLGEHNPPGQRKACVAGGKTTTEILKLVAHRVEHLRASAHGLSYTFRHGGPDLEPTAFHDLPGPWVVEGPGLYPSLTFQDRETAAVVARALNQAREAALCLSEEV